MNQGFKQVSRKKKNQQPKEAQPDKKSQARPSILSNNRYANLESQDEESYDSVEKVIHHNNSKTKAEQQKKEQKFP